MLTALFFTGYSALNCMVPSLQKSKGKSTELMTIITPYILVLRPTGQHYVVQILSRRICEYF